MRITQDRFTMPLCVLDEPMPSKQLKLLMFLFICSDFGGTCRPGYAAMRAAIRDDDSEKGCDSTIKRYLKDLSKRGWIFATKRTNGRMAIWLQIPARFRPAKNPKNAISVLSP